MHLLKRHYKYITADHAAQTHLMQTPLRSHRSRSRYRSRSCVNATLPRHHNILARHHANANALKPRRPRSCHTDTLPASATKTASPQVTQHTRHTSRSTPTYPANAKIRRHYDLARHHAAHASGSSYYRSTTTMSIQKTVSPQVTQHTRHRSRSTPTYPANAIITRHCDLARHHAAHASGSSYYRSSTTMSSQIVIQDCPKKMPFKNVLKDCVSKRVHSDSPITMHVYPTRVCM